MATPPPSADPWYAKGLRFRCTACGRCCGGSPGFVWVTDADVRRMAKHRGIPADEFERVYVRRVGERMSLKEERNGDCVMLEGGRCSVYAAKPTPCSTFPFWDAVLETPQAWAETAALCPGMDQGDAYARDEIEALASGVSAPLLEKQAAARAAAAGVPPAVSEETWAAAFRDLERVYADLEAELPRHEFTCVASGDCCDFDAYGHRLYATTLEAEWFFRNSPRQRANANPRHCPAWGPDRLCKARTGRMLGCRTFFCAGKRGSDPNEIYERYYRLVKDVHDRHGLPFRYADVTEWARERRPAPS